jgi:hypothetical protein
MILRLKAALKCENVVSMAQGISITIAIFSGEHAMGEQIVILWASIDLIHPHYDPEVDSACNRNEYQEYSWG